MVPTKDVASRILQRNFSELVLLATKNKLSTSGDEHKFASSSVYQIKVPEKLTVIEAATENASSYRKGSKLIVTDVRNLVFVAPGQQHYFTEFENRTLSSSESEDRRIICRLIEKAIDINIRKLTGNGMLQGIYLVEEPMKLYKCEKASL